MITPTAFPKSYQSAFRPACFEFSGVDAQGGMDFEIGAGTASAPLGVKRIWAQNSARINVAPYVRRLFTPEPLCSSPAGMVAGRGRIVWCYVQVPGYRSPAVPLACGTEDTETNKILSAAPRRVTIRQGERDEVSILTPSLTVKPSIVFTHRGSEYIDDSLTSLLSDGPVTMVVDADAVAGRFVSLTGAPASEMTGFKVRLTVAASRTMPELRFEREYLFDRVSHRGQRLAWVNRYGAIDYYTFPSVGEGRISGSRTRIETPDGYRTVATAEKSSVELASAPCSALEAEWLAEIFSSPLVWLIDGPHYERIEVADGEVIHSLLTPSTVSVKIAPFTKAVSRKF